MHCSLSPSLPFPLFLPTPHLSPENTGSQDAKLPPALFFWKLCQQEGPASPHPYMGLEAFPLPAIVPSARPNQYPVCLRSCSLGSWPGGFSESLPQYMQGTPGPTSRGKYISGPGFFNRILLKSVQSRGHIALTFRGPPRPQPEIPLERPVTVLSLSFPAAEDRVRRYSALIVLTPDVTVVCSSCHCHDAN